MPRASAETPAAKRSDPSVRVLLVVGDKALANTIDLTLQHGPYARRVVASVAEGKTAIEEWEPHLLLVDIDVEAGRAIQLIDDARARADGSDRPDAPQRPPREARRVRARRRRLHRRSVRAGRPGRPCPCRDPQDPRQRRKAPSPSAHR